MPGDSPPTHLMAQLVGHPVLVLESDGTVVDHAGTARLQVPAKIEEPHDLQSMLRSTNATPASWTVDGNQWRVMGARWSASSTLIVAILVPREQAGFALLNRQILELRNRETELRSALDRANRAEADALHVANRYSSLVASNPSPTARFDEKLTITELNGAFAGLFDLAESALLGRSLGDVTIFGNDGVTTLTDSIKRCFDERQVVELESVSFVVDGTLRWLDLWLVPENPVDAMSTASVLVIGSDVTRRVVNEHELATLATTDPLTGLLNRRAFNDRLSHALAQLERAGGGLAVLIIDLDNFKLINDTAGHQVGDQVLQRVAQQLTDTSRQGDTVARLGGDEFAIIAEQIDQVEEAMELAVRILAVLNAPPKPGDHPATASIGVAQVDKTTDPESIVRDADAAMYEAKRLGRARIVRFEPSMRTKSTSESREG